MPPPNPLIVATVDHLSRFVPFDAMSPEHLAWLAERLKLDYFAKGEVVMEPSEGAVKRMLIIKQGTVVGEQDGQEAWIELHEGEAFPIGALLSNRADRKSVV
jgi:CBS domain-containing protein